ALRWLTSWTTIPACELSPTGGAVQYRGCRLMTPGTEGFTNAYSLRLYFGSDGMVFRNVNGSRSPWFIAPRLFSMICPSRWSYFPMALAYASVGPPQMLPLWMSAIACAV